MKKIFPLFGLLVCGAASFAQCDKSQLIRASKTEYLDADSILQKTVEENTIIEISKTDISIRPGDKKMNGVINSADCVWAMPFTEGKTILKTTFTDENGNKKNSTITIEGKAGKLTLFLQVEEMSFIIRVPIDQFIEKS